MKFEGGEITSETLHTLNTLGTLYRQSKKKELLHKLKMHLPESFLQKATYSFNYKTAMHMYFDRKNHRMPEWSGPEGICEWLLRLPYMKIFVSEAPHDKTKE